MKGPTVMALTKRVERLGRENRQSIGGRFFLVLVLPSLLLLSTGRAEAFCWPSIPTPPGSSASYQYVSALIDSFAYAKEADARTKRAVAALAATPVRTQSDFLGAISDFMYQVKTAGQEYQCATKLTEGFLTSANRAIRISAEAAHSVYTDVAQLDAKILSEMATVLDSGRVDALGQSLSRQADLRVAMDETWKVLLLASVAATHALVALPDRPDERLSRLSVTRAERKELLQALEKVFGPSVKQGLRAGQAALEGSGASIHQFLSQAEWKAVDDK